MRKLCALIVVTLALACATPSSAFGQGKEMPDADGKTPSAEPATKADVQKVLDAIKDLRKVVQDGDAAAEKRFDRIDKRFDSADKRLDGIENRLGAVEKKVDGLSAGFDVMKVKVTELTAGQKELREQLTKLGTDFAAVLKDKDRFKVEVKVINSPPTAPPTCARAPRRCATDEGYEPCYYGYPQFYCYRPNYGAPQYYLWYQNSWYNYNCWGGYQYQYNWYRYWWGC